MRLSIAMATYNGGQYLKAQLQSFLDQTRQPDELIITDDCSTDETEAIVKEFSKSAPFTVKFFRNEKNLGYCGNFNAALMKTTGDLVFLSDQDDVWFPEKIEYMLSIAELRPEALVLMNNAALTDGNLNEVGLTKIGQIRSAGLPMTTFVMGCCCAVRRELLDFCMPIAEGFEGHDNWLVFFAAGLDAKIIDERALQYYRRHESNESQFIVNRTNKITKVHRFANHLKRLFSPSKERKPEERAHQYKLFSEGVVRALDVAPTKYNDRLTSLYEKNFRLFHFQLKRAEIRQQPVVKRVVDVGTLYIKQGSNKYYGIRSAMHDLFG